MVFIHGLSGHIERTWTSNASNSPVIWPKWLAEDVPGIGLWFVGYPAAKTNWGGYGIPVPDRADNVLARLLAEPALTKGNIVFIAHSLGGLVVEQILRNAQRNADSNRQTEDFLARVRRVAFLGTPHRGTLLANVSKALLLIRPSAVTRDLVLGNSQLRDLNYWYRQYSRASGIENLILAEGRPVRVLGIALPEVIGTVVSLGSADAGLREIPITVDENHTGISKPANRESEVYVHVRDFVSRPFDVAPQVPQIAEALEKNTTELQRLTERSQEHSATIAYLGRTISENSNVLKVDPTIIDTEVARRLERLRKCRLFGEFDTIKEVQSLIASLEDGDLSLASDAEKATALAWCARFVSGDAPGEAESILDRIASPNSELNGIARGLITASRGDLYQALSELCAIGTPVACGTAYIIILRANGFEDAAKWLHKAGLALADLDSDAKFFYLRKSLEEGSWDIAFEAAKGLVDADFERSPGLIFATADAFLMQAVPNELRMTLMQYRPMNDAEFPLRSEPSALEHRRTAMRFYKRLYSVADSLGMSSIAGYADDKALWLRLMDPEATAEARRELEESVKDTSTFLRRLGLALQFHVDIDLERAEREVDRQTALSGGMSHDAAVARFALAFTRGSHASAAAYVGEHREQLLQHLDWKGIYFFEIEMLATSGQTAKAEERLKEANERGLTEQEIARLRSELAAATGGDPIAERLAAYEASKSIVDLRILVSAYGNANDWQKACDYGKTLLDLTGDLADARRFVISLYNIERHDEALNVLETYPALLTQDDALRFLRVQTLYESGRLNDALTALQELRQANDSPEARQLQINLAVGSGDWESLQGFVEAEWNARADRTAIELLRAGQIAQHIGARRGKGLVQEAAHRSPDDPAILVNCYHAASAAGWENSSEVHQWMERAALRSGADGPVQIMAIEDIFKQQPDWERRESSAWDLLAKGEIPIFTAGRLLNRSLLSLYLLPALCNLDEPDVRRRPMIYAFSGSRGKHKVNPGIVAMDATALITAEFLGLLNACIATFDNIVIPHSTLGWLLEEKARILFHQPSRVFAARELRQMISEGNLRVFEGSINAPENLMNEVGRTLAELIAEASSKEHPDARQRLVVRGGPVYKANSFMGEEANLSLYESNLCSCVDVVKKLAQKGLLTQQEATDAYSALNVREKPWPSKPQITDEAVLYLDDLAVSHLQFLGLLSKLHRADITAFVSRSEIEEADALIAYDTKGSDVVSVVERLRQHLREGLANGKVRLGKAIRIDDKDRPEAMMAHPTIAMLKLIGETHVGVVDDRFINQHASMALETISRPLLTTVDLLDVLKDRGGITAGQRQEAITTLRLANFALMPVAVEELTALIANSSVSDGILEETAELRAVRESIQRVRMSDMLQLPKELAWLISVTQTCLLTLKEQWKDGLDEATIVARSDWLLALSDFRGWAHCLNENTQQLMERYRNWVAMLVMLPVIQPQPVKEIYWRWFESRILQPIEEEDSDSYKFLVEQAKELVARSVEMCEQSLEHADE